MEVVYLIILEINEEQRRESEQGREPTKAVFFYSTLITVGNWNLTPLRTIREGEGEGAGIFIHHLPYVESFLGEY